MERFGIPGLDQILNGLSLGDNVVWQVDDLETIGFSSPPGTSGLPGRTEGSSICDLPVTRPCWKTTPCDRLPAGRPQRVRILFHPGHRSSPGRDGGPIYVFDCLSDLLPAWANDLMIGNFFKITCPYLFELNTIAYFAILRDQPFIQDHRPDPRNDPASSRRLQVQGEILHPSRLRSGTGILPPCSCPTCRKREKFVPITNSVGRHQILLRIFDKAPKAREEPGLLGPALFERREDLAGPDRLSEREEET